MTYPVCRTFASVSSLSGPLYTEYCRWYSLTSYSIIDSMVYFFKNTNEGCYTSLERKRGDAHLLLIGPES